MPASKHQRNKVREVMHEFKEGDLRLGKSGKKATNPKQAIAIAMSESGQSRGCKKTSSGGDRSSLSKSTSSSKPRTAASRRTHSAKKSV